MAAQIRNGRWTRHVTWQRDGIWRTDIFKTTLADPRLIEAEFVLKNGSRVIIPAAELRRVLIGGSDHYNGKIWGPFNVDPVRKTVEGQSCRMEITDAI
ncbi:MAG: hypothetical protein ACLQU2_06205 [Candidatus Binataceae bacterium]